MTWELRLSVVISILNFILSTPVTHCIKSRHGVSLKRPLTAGSVSASDSLEEKQSVKLTAENETEKNPDARLHDWRSNGKQGQLDQGFQTMACFSELVVELKCIFEHHSCVALAWTIFRTDGQFHSTRFCNSNLKSPLNCRVVVFWRSGAHPARLKFQSLMSLKTVRFRCPVV